MVWPKEKISKSDVICPPKTYVAGGSEAPVEGMQPIVQYMPTGRQVLQLDERVTSTM